MLLFEDVMDENKQLKAEKDSIIRECFKLKKENRELKEELNKVTYRYEYLRKEYIGEGQ